MTEREKHEAIVIAAFDVAHSMFERAVLAWDFFGDDERKKIIDAVLAESKRVGLVPIVTKWRGDVESDARVVTVTDFGNGKSKFQDLFIYRPWRKLGVMP
jgi:hypothetical protein